MTSGRHAVRPRHASSRSTHPRPAIRPSIAAISPSLLLWSGLSCTVMGASTFFVQGSPPTAAFDVRGAGLMLCLAGAGLAAAGFVLEDRYWQARLGLTIVPMALALTLLYIGVAY